MSKFFGSLLLVAAFPLLVQAQGSPKPTEGKISGQIVDGKSAPVPYATVTLLRQDSSIINGDLTKEDGSFNIEPTGTGSFILRVNIIGFKQRYIDNIKISHEALNRNLGKLTISATTQALQEVQVTGEKALMEMSVDKKVFNVEKNITSSGGSAADVLKNVPSLAVDVDGDILLRGKETTLLIDGKPATLLGGDVASALQSLPSSSIQSVEVITNPSARFDAQGMAGIINIITKKDSRFGLNGSVSLGAGTRDKYNGSLSLNLRNDKWNFFFNSSYRRNRNYQRTMNERWENGVRTSSSFEDNLRLHGGFFNTIGAEYAISKTSSITLTENINQMQWGNDGTTTYKYSSDGIKQDSSSIRKSYNLGGPISSSTSLDFKQKFKRPKQELTANITFAKTWVDREQEFTTTRNDGLDQQVGDVVTQKAPGGGFSSSLNGQADYTMPFLSKDGKLDIGWKSQLYWFESNNDAQIKYSDATDFVKDTTLQNDYNYDQQIHAGYVSFSDQKGKFGYQAGLRLEYSHYQGTSSLIDTNDYPDRKYGNEFLSLFPSAYISYKLPKDQAMYLSYTRRTNRPNFFQMMPYKDISNPMDTSLGNPNLIPEFIHNFELNYSRQFKGHTVIASAYYQYTQNLIDRIRRFDTATGRSSSKPQNLTNGVTYGLELTGRFQIMPIWDATVNFNFFQNDIHSDLSSTLNNSGSSWFTKLNTNVKLPYNFSLQFSGTYEAPKVAAQGSVQDVYWLDVALRKNLWNNKANIVLNISDIFNSRKYTNTYDLPNAYQTIYRDRETRVGNITFTYRFGRSDTKSSGRRGQQNGQPQVKDRDNLKQGDGDQGGF